MKFLFVVNPISGGIDKEPFLKRASDLCKKYGHDYNIFKTTGKDDRAHLLKMLEKINPDKVLSVGGDGTTLFTALTLRDSDYPMGIIPMGSANGMATELFVNPDPIEALKDIIMSNIFVGLDLVKVNNIYYSIHIGDVGVNAQIVNNYDKDPERGMITYAKYFLEQLKQLAQFPVTVIANGREFKSEAYMVAICNARKFGTGIPLNLEGNPLDGKFEIVMIKRIDATSLIKSGLSRFDESFFDSQSGELISTDNAKIIFDKPRLLQLDGEIIGEYKELNIEIVKSAVKFITHTDNKYLDTIT